MKKITQEEFNAGTKKNGIKKCNHPYEKLQIVSNTKKDPFTDVDGNPTGQPSWIAICTVCDEVVQADGCLYKTN